VAIEIDKVGVPDTQLGAPFYCVVSSLIDTHHALSAERGRLLPAEIGIGPKRFVMCNSSNQLQVIGYFQILPGRLFPSGIACDH
jgi:hypothetical protein